MALNRRARTLVGAATIALTVSAPSALAQKGDAEPDAEPPGADTEGELVACADDRVTAILAFLYPIPPGAEQTDPLRDEVGAHAADLLTTAEAVIGGPDYDCRTADGGNRSLAPQIDRLRLIVGD